MTIVEVQADGLAKSGDGICSTGAPRGGPLHVPNLLPGERAEVRVVHRGKHRSHGVVVKHLKPDPERRQPPCPRQGQCDGCPLMGASEALQVETKRSLLMKLGIEVERVVQLDEAEGYRWSAKRVVGGEAGAIVLGSYKRGSHELASMAGCLVDHPDIARAADELSRVASTLGVEPYDEATGQGDLRYVWLKTDGAGQVLVTLITASKDTRAQGLADGLSRAAGVAWCVQASDGNAIRGAPAVILAGADHLDVTLCDQIVSVGPLGFLQPNPRVAELAYRRLVADRRGSLAVDLYAGSGIITSLLRSSFERVLACESYPESAATLGIEPLPVADFLDAVIERGESPELVVANPPRAGLGAEVCDKLAKIKPARLHIMSCDPWAMARDLQRLQGFVIDDAMAYDTLPHTAHVELVVRMHAQCTSGLGEALPGD